MLVSFMSVEMLLSLKLVFDAIDFFTENVVSVGLRAPRSGFLGSVLLSSYMLVKILQDSANTHGILVPWISFYSLAAVVCLREVWPHLKTWLSLL